MQNKHLIPYRGEFKLWKNKQNWISWTNKTSKLLLNKKIAFCSYSITTSLARGDTCNTFHAGQTTMLHVSSQ